jgi:hypothetical protein
MLRAKLIGKKQIAKATKTNNSTNHSSISQQSLAATRTSNASETQLQRKIKQLETQLQEQAQLLQHLIHLQKQPTTIGDALVAEQANNAVVGTSTLGKDKGSQIATSRRGLLKKLGIAMAGAASATTIVSSFEPTRAHAATGDTLLVGNSNLGSNTTYISQKGNVSELDDKALLWVDWNNSGKSPKPTINTAIAGTAEGAAVGGYFKGGQAPLLLAPGATQGAPGSGTHSQGELYIDNQGELYLCQAGNTPGPVKWTKLSGSTGSTITPRQIATKRWFEANQSYSSISVPALPRQFVFDGNNMWIVLSQSLGRYVAKIDAANLTSIGSYMLSGPSIRDLIFTGTNLIYQSSRGDVGTVQLSDGTITNSYTITIAAAPNPPVGPITYDGKYIWTSTPQKIIKTDLMTETVYTHSSLTTGGSSLFADGFLWVANGGGGNNLFKFNVGDGSLVATYSTGAANPRRLTFDGVHLWAINDNNIITKTRTSDGALVGTFTSVGNPVGMVFDGYYIWTCGSNGVTKLRANDGTTIGVYTATNPANGSTNTNFDCIGFDGHRIWAGNSSATTYLAWLF